MHWGVKYGIEVLMDSFVFGTHLSSKLATFKLSTDLGEIVRPSFYFHATLHDFHRHNSCDLAAVLPHMQSSVSDFEVQTPPIYTKQSTKENIEYLKGEKLCDFTWHIASA